MDHRPFPLRALCLVCAALAGLIGAVSLVSDDPALEAAPPPLASSQAPARPRFPSPIPIPDSGSPELDLPEAADASPPSGSDALEADPWSPDDPPGDGAGS